MRNQILVSIYVGMFLIAGGETETARAQEKNIVARPAFDRTPQAWERREKPILSASTTEQSWCKVVLYSPHVIYHEGRFRMWYLGTSTASRSNDMALGYAESPDGIRWTEHPKNPILTGSDVPWGRLWQTPFVLFDADERLYKMWFVSSDGVRRDDKNRIVSNAQQLGYATSPDGIRWKVRAKPIYPSGRSPSVLKEGPRRYRMWMGSRPDLEDRSSSSIYENVYEFTSTDGIDWKRSDKPVLRPSGKARSVVYPFVRKEKGTYYMWHGCHVSGGKFEIFCATSKDGTKWSVSHTQPTFSARETKGAFDSRYVSTPCVVGVQGHFLLYYSARDEKTTYTDKHGRKRRDGSGVYAHIGAAILSSKGKR